MLGFGLGLNKWRRVGGGFVGLLDLYPNAAAAYSLRKLRAAYSGSAVRVRKEVSSVSSETDIGFLADGSLDTVSLLSFASDADSGDVFVVTWYDQSLSNDATQSTASAQPKIVSAGSLVEENGKPAVDFDGVNDYLSATTVAYSQPNTIFSLVNARAIGGNDYIYDSANTSNRNALASFMFAGSVLSVSGYAINTQQLRSNLFDSTNSINWVNGTQTTTGNAGSQSMQGITLAANRTGTDNAPIKHQEFILYNSNETSNRTGIETNINTFYSIYP